MTMFSSFEMTNLIHFVQSQMALYSYSMYMTNMYMTNMPWYIIHMIVLFYMMILSYTGTIFLLNKFSVFRVTLFSMGLKCLMGIMFFCVLYNMGIIMNTYVPLHQSSILFKISYFITCMFFKICFIYASQLDFVEMVGDIPYTIPYPTDSDTASTWLNIFYGMTYMIMFFFLVEGVKMVHLRMVEVHEGEFVVSHLMDTLDRSGKNLKSLFGFNGFNVMGSFLVNDVHGPYYGMTYFENGDYFSKLPLAAWFHLTSPMFMRAGFDASYFDMSHMTCKFMAPNSMHWSNLLWTQNFIVKTGRMQDPVFLFPWNIQPFGGVDSMLVSVMPSWNSSLWTVVSQDDAWNIR